MPSNRAWISLFFLWLMLACPATVFCSGEQEQTPEQYIEKRERL